MDYDIIEYNKVEKYNYIHSFRNLMKTTIVCFTKNINLKKLLYSTIWARIINVITFENLLLTINPKIKVINFSRISYGVIFY